VRTSPKQRRVQSSECIRTWQEKGISRIKMWVRRLQDTETSMPIGEPTDANCVQKSDDSRFCNSHCLSHFAAFFIVMGTKISIVENLVLVLVLVRLLWLIRFMMRQQNRPAFASSHYCSTKGSVKICGLVLVILPQVHLRKPCYDFSFL
jgi:hypothetical protein